MRSSWKSLVAAAVGLLALPHFAAADEVQEQLQQMQERMSQLEEKLEATTDQLEDSNRKVDEQQQMIERAGLEDRSAASEIASFFESVEFEGWVSSSYWWNTNNPNNPLGVAGSPNGIGAGVLAGGAPNTGTFGTAVPFHPDHNTFQLDQLWFSMAKPATSESRGGFAADLVFGKTADTLVNGQSNFVTGSLGIPNVTTNGNGAYVYQAYAEYLAPIGPGVNIKGGRFATHIGAEVAQTTQNFNITRGLVYSILQPVNHVGVMASTELDSGFSFGLGVVNDSLANLNTDVENDKSYLWTLGFSQENWGITHNGLYGRTGGPGGTKFGINDFVVNWDPSENLSTWIDVTHVWTNGSGATGDPWAIGTALAGRLAITESTGFSLRGEYLFGNKNFFVAPGNAFVAPPVGDQHLWSITGTLDHALTEALMVRGEVRYEQGAQDGGTNKIYYFEDGATPITDSQVLLGAEMIYRF